MINQDEYVLARVKAELLRRKNAKDAPQFMYPEDALAIIAKAEVDAILGEQELEEAEKEAE